MNLTAFVAIAGAFQKEFHDFCANRDTCTACPMQNLIGCSGANLGMVGAEATISDPSSWNFEDVIASYRGYKIKTSPSIKFSAKTQFSTLTADSYDDIVKKLAAVDLELKLTNSIEDGNKDQFIEGFLDLLVGSDSFRTETLKLLEDIGGKANGLNTSKEAG